MGKRKAKISICIVFPSATDLMKNVEQICIIKALKNINRYFILKISLKFCYHLETESQHL